MPRAAVEPIHDLGPEARRARGDVVVAYRADPTRPNAPDIRGASRLVHYHALWAQGFLDDIQHEAADRYLVRLEQAQGAIEGSPERPQGIRGGGAVGPTERQVIALTDLRMADEALGLERDMVRAVVGWNIKPRDEDVGTPANPGPFADALTRLARFWQM